jgi:hypothetical protein
MYSRKITTKLMPAVAVALCTLSGALVGGILGPEAAHAQKACERNACSGSTGNCFVTDYNVNCMETSGGSGCANYAC